MLTHVGGDEALLRELVDVFRQDGPRLLGEIAEALRAGDTAVMNESAHTLKGMVAFFGIRSVTAAAEKLEALGRQGDAEQARIAYAELVREVTRLEEGLAPLATAPARPASNSATSVEAEESMVKLQAPSPAEPGTVDTTVMLSRLGGDQNLLRELVDVFQLDCPRLMTEMRAAIQAGDAAGLNEAAHSMKGMVAFFDVRSLTATALHLEALGRAGNLSQAADVLADLEREVGRLQAVLTTLVDVPSS
jgi:HPt (histidine-containing phosphotransfer) domain-containing protein